MKSRFLRKAFRQGYNIKVGEYSYGCFDRDRFTPNMTIGGYCLFSRSCRRVNANHMLNFLSLHPYFYNTKFGVVAQEQVERFHCQIGDDVWVGHNVVILPTITAIGRGAVLAAGAIVTKKCSQLQYRRRRSCKSDFKAVQRRHHRKNRSFALVGTLERGPQECRG